MKPPNAKMVESVERRPLKSKEHLLEWLHQSGRRYMVLRSDDLVNALCESYGWPEGAQVIQDVVERYNDYRSRQVVGDLRKSDVLTAAESTEAITELVTHASTVDENWQPPFAKG